MKWPILACLPGSLLIAAVFLTGCDNSGGKLVHGDGAKLLIEAMKNRTQDEDKCLELLDKSIAAQPTGSAYFHRGWIYAKRGDFDKANDSVRLGLEIDPQSGDLKWLAAELEKPEQQRSLKMPPSTRK